MELISSTDEVANVLVSDSPLATHWQEHLRTVFTTQLQAGTLSITVHLHSYTVQGALVVVGKSVDSADRPVLSITVARSQTGSSAH